MVAMARNDEVVELAGRRSLFTTENASEMGRRSADARRRRTAERDRDTSAMRALVAKRIQDMGGRDALRDLSLANALDLAHRYFNGEWPPKSAAEATRDARAWHEVLRLESDEATVITTTEEDRRERLAELRRKAAERAGHSDQ
jgi:hypothetical protein